MSIYEGCNYLQCDSDLKQDCKYMNFCVLAGPNNLCGSREEAARALHNLMLKVFDMEEELSKVKNRLDYLENNKGQLDLD
jgi:hypothetical protein